MTKHVSHANCMAISTARMLGIDTNINISDEDWPTLEIPEHDIRIEWHQQTRHRDPSITVSEQGKTRQHFKIGNDGVGVTNFLRESAVIDQMWRDRLARERANPKCPRCQRPL